MARSGQSAEALAIFERIVVEYPHAERDAANNAELFAALARAYRRGGDDRRALEYYNHALPLAPGDPALGALGPSKR